MSKGGGGRTDFGTAALHVRSVTSVFPGVFRVWGWRVGGEVRGDGFGSRAVKGLCRFVQWARMG